MDSLNLVEFARTLIDIDSTTGREGEAARVLADALRGLGYRVDLQPVTGDRVNVYARVDDPAVVLSTHVDCVPDFFPSRVEHGRLFGRGSSDAKGILAAQVVAAERVRAAGERRVGLLFVAGEERGSDGAAAANGMAPASVKYLVNGEPTDNRLAAGTRGVYRVLLEATGRAAHSSRPDLGESAIDKLVDALVAMRAASWPADVVWGETHFNTGVISGGVAPNVIPAQAGAEILFRTVGDHAAVHDVLARTVGALVRITEVLVVPPVRLETRPGFDTAVFSYTTDIPLLSNWGTPLLIGPGSVEQAHTKDESVAIAELHDAADLYVRLVMDLLRQPAG